MCEYPAVPVAKWGLVNRARRQQTSLHPYSAWPPQCPISRHKRREVQWGLRSHRHKGNRRWEDLERAHNQRVLDSSRHQVIREAQEQNTQVAIPCSEFSSQVFPNNQQLIHRGWLPAGNWNQTLKRPNVDFSKPFVAGSPANCKKGHGHEYTTPSGRRSGITNWQSQPCICQLHAG